MPVVIAKRRTDRLKRCTLCDEKIRMRELINENLRGEITHKNCVEARSFQRELVHRRLEKKGFSHRRFE